MTKEVIDFLELLEKEIDKFNGFFVDKEELYIIRLKMLKEEVAEAKDSEVELMKIGRKIVDFDGEMILLDNYSALNYTGSCLIYTLIFVNGLLYLVNVHRYVK
ncbi:SPX domain-containing protein 2 [Forsythia ovata]|uniref:SPX domain-containing protein 2 n=1 Tax=Forsythia ovata TaxID=205694 RepID=A0ABD1V2H9_9LAMI